MIILYIYYYYIKKTSPFFPYLCSPDNAWCHVWCHLHLRCAVTQIFRGGP